MSDSFGNIFDQQSQVNPTAVSEGASDDKKAKANAMKAAMRESLTQDASFQERMNTLSKSLRVTHSLGFGKGGNIIEDKEAKARGEHKVTPTSAIVGYQIENVGKTPITYTTEEFSAGADGIFTGKIVEKTIAPKEVVNISRKYLAALASAPEFSFVLANGKIVSPKRTFANFNDELAAHYFKFDDDTKVNDDKVKISIDDDGKVKPEFQATFGWLNNPKQGRAKRQAGPKFSTQDIAANWIHTMLKEQGLQ